MQRNNSITEWCNIYHLGCLNLIVSFVYLSKYVDFYKIGSYELLRLDIFKKCIKYKKNIIFSTGMATSSEINKVLTHD